MSLQYYLNAFSAQWKEWEKYARWNTWSKYTRYEMLEEE